MEVGVKKSAPRIRGAFLLLGSVVKIYETTNLPPTPHTMEQKIIILIGHSGVGRERATKYAVEYFSQMVMPSVSVATRPPRRKEVRGREYDFWDEENRRRKFLLAARNKYFLEWEHIYKGDNGYRGTPNSEIQRLWDMGKTPILDVEIKGGLRIRDKHPQESVCVPILPVTPELWELHLRSRFAEDGGDPKDLETRILKAPQEAELIRREFGKKEIVINDFGPFFFNRIINRIADLVPHLRFQRV